MFFKIILWKLLGVNKDTKTESRMNVINNYITMLLMPNYSTIIIPKFHLIYLLIDNVIYALLIDQEYASQYILYFSYW